MKKQFWLISFFVSTWAVVALVGIFLLALIWPKFRRDIIGEIIERTGARY